jgi:hypothetical protein
MVIGFAAPVTHQVLAWPWIGLAVPRNAGQKNFGSEPLPNNWPSLICATMTKQMVFNQTYNGWRRGQQNNPHNL